MATRNVTRKSLIIALATVAAALVLALSAGVPSASAAAYAAPAHTHALKTRGTANPAAAGTNNMTYQGGPVETTPVVYISWWGAQWMTGFSTGGYSSATAQTYTTSFFSNVGGSAWDNINAQYCQSVALGTVNCGSAGTHIQNRTGQLAGTWNDTTKLPRSITQTAIASAAIRLMNHFGGYNPNATYFVYTPHGHSMSGFATQWCAWHDVTISSGHAVAYAYMPYQPDAGASCGRNFVNGTNNSFGNGYFDGFSVVGGHEYAEALTDPHPASGTFGWIDSSGSEIGDKCAWSPLSTNITLGSHFFAVQPLWSNANSGCVTAH